MSEMTNTMAVDPDAIPVVAPRRRRWPDYLVTAPHAVALSGRDSYPSAPHGRWHARQVGSLQTACGIPAVTWRFFWTLDFGRAGLMTCVECVEAIRSGP